MNNRTADIRSTDEFRYKGGRRLLALGMWLRFVLVGAMAVTGGLIQLVVGEAINLAAPAFVGGGAVLMAFASWRVRSLLGDAGPPTVEPVIVRRTVLAAE